MANFKDLQTKIGYMFKNESLLVTALTHSSYVNEHKINRLKCNERLEFLGDAVLGFVTSEYLFDRKPMLMEGQMTRLRAELVCERSLVEAAKQLDLGAYLRLGKGEDISGARERPSLLADAMEATFAAVFLDGGREPASKLIHKLILSRADTSRIRGSDYKTALQEIVQRTPGVPIVYKVAGEDGPDHRKTFRIELLVGGKVRGYGEGGSKKAAEQAAARAALASMEAPLIGEDASAKGE